MQDDFGVRLIDWKRPGARSARRVMAHVARALLPSRGATAVLSDGEHVGIPLSLAMRSLGFHTPHVVIGHHVDTPLKAPFFRYLGADQGIDRILVHSRRQRDVLVTKLKLQPSLVHFVPYGVDTRFWCAQYGRKSTGEEFILTVGSEHRDYVSLIDAAPESARILVASNSPFSPTAHQRVPETWPTNVDRIAPSFLGLRLLYSLASVVVVPLLPTDFPAGITAVLEAMSMGKAVVVSTTEGLAGLIDPETAVTVPPGDATALASAISKLLADPAERARLGERARRFVAAQYSLDRYVTALVGHLSEVADLKGRDRRG